MAKNTQLTAQLANAQGDTLARQLDNGYIKIYSGTQPATGDTALSGNTLLSTLRFSATSAPATSGGVVTFNAIASDTNAAATGTASFARLLKSDGTTAVMDISIGTSAANLVLSSVSISAGQTVSISSFTHTVQESTSGL